MRNIYSKLALSFVVGAGLVLGAGGTASTAKAQKSGGLLNFVVGSKIPSYDLHRRLRSVSFIQSARSTAC